jgi:hypothetical protein
MEGNFMETILKQLLLKATKHVEWGMVLAEL